VFALLPVSSLPTGSQEMIKIDLRPVMGIKISDVYLLGSAIVCEAIRLSFASMNFMVDIWSRADGMRLIGFPDPSDLVAYLTIESFLVFEDRLNWEATSVANSSRASHQGKISEIFRQGSN